MQNANKYRSQGWLFFACARTSTVQTAESDEGAISRMTAIGSNNDMSLFKPIVSERPTTASWVGHAPPDRWRVAGRRQAARAAVWLCIAVAIAFEFVATDCCARCSREFERILNAGKDLWFARRPV